MIYKEYSIIAFYDDEDNLVEEASSWQELGEIIEKDKKNLITFRSSVSHYFRGKIDHVRIHGKKCKPYLIK